MMECIPFNTDKWPTIDRNDPYSLNDDELDLVNEYITFSATVSRCNRHMDLSSRVAKHMPVLQRKSPVPRLHTDDRGRHEFARVRHGGVWYSGKSLMDYSDMVVKNAWAKHDESARWDMMVPLVRQRQSVLLPSVPHL